MKKIFEKILAVIKGKHIIVNFSHIRVDGINPGYMQGGIIEAKVIEETENAFKIKFAKRFLPLNFSLGDKINTHIFTEWILKNDPRIVEVLK